MSDYFRIAREVELPRKVKFWPAVVFLFRLATGHRRVWGARGRWGRENPFRKYDRENPS